MLCNNVSLTVQQFEHNVLSPEFPGLMCSLSLLETSCLFREYLKCIQLKRCVKSASHYFYCFYGFKSMTMVMCQMDMGPNTVYTFCYSSFSTNHVGCPIMTLNFYNPLIINSTLDMLNTTEYLLFQIKYFQKRHI